MTDDDHGLDVEEDTDLDTADDDEQTAEKYDADRDLNPASRAQ